MNEQARKLLEETIGHIIKEDQESASKSFTAYLEIKAAQILEGKDDEEAEDDDIEKESDSGDDDEDGEEDKESKEKSADDSEDDEDSDEKVEEK